MLSTSDTSNKSGSAALQMKHEDEPRMLTTAAIKHLLDSADQKHHNNINLVLQITRVRDLNQEKVPSASKATNGAAANGSAAKPKNNSIKHK